VLKRLCIGPSTVRAVDLSIKGVEASFYQRSTYITRTPRAPNTVEMPPHVAVLGTLVFDGSVAQGAVVRVIGRELSTACSHRQLAVVVLNRVKITQIIKKLIQTSRGICFTLKAQCTLKANSDEELEIMSEASNK